MPKKAVRYVSLAASVILAVIIFTMSAQTAERSSASSGGVCAFILSVFDKDYRTMSEEEKLAKIEDISFVVRKCAHFTEYALLGFFLYGCFGTYGIKKLYAFLISFGCGALYSVSDEIHQHFVEGRSAQLSDVIIDSSGVLFGCAVMLLLMPLIIRRES